jgi:phosphoribosyl-AMP cyclohydrolase
MVAFTDEAGFAASLESGKVSLYSTSRGKSWVKGEESGNWMKIIGVRVDCDGDAVLYLVEPQGPGLACHTNAKSCFYRDIRGSSEAAPKAGAHEALELVDLPVHADLQ